MPCFLFHQEIKLLICNKELKHIFWSSKFTKEYIQYYLCNDNYILKFESFNEINNIIFECDTISLNLINNMKIDETKTKLISENELNKMLLIYEIIK